VRADGSTGRVVVVTTDVSAAVGIRPITLPARVECDDATFDVVLLPIDALPRHVLHPLVPLPEAHKLACLVWSLFAEAQLYAAALRLAGVCARTLSPRHNGLRLPVHAWIAAERDTATQHGGAAQAVMNAASDVTHRGSRVWLLDRLAYPRHSAVRPIAGGTVVGISFAQRLALRAVLAAATTTLPPWMLTTMTDILVVTQCGAAVNAFAEPPNPSSVDGVTATENTAKAVRPDGSDSDGDIVVGHYNGALDLL
jgi:hypothetical protein